MQGYNFTERVRRVLMRAREEALQLRHEYVGTEHILLAIAAELEGVAHTVLQEARITPDAIRDEVLGIVKRGTGAHVGDLPYTSRAKKVIELSMLEVRDMGHACVGTEHLLLGLLREERGIAAQVLSVLGLTLPAAREQVRRLRGDGVAGSDPVDRATAPVEHATSITLIVERGAGQLEARKFASPREAARFLRRYES